MATKVGQLKYSVGFDVKKSDLNTLKASLQELKKLSISDLMKINDSDMKHATEAFFQIRREAQKVEEAIKSAFNAKLNTVNIETFNQKLISLDTSVEKIYSTFSKGGVAGQNAFRSLTSQVLTVNTQLKETHKFLDNISTTLANTVKWNVASTAINGMTQAVQQAWGYVKNLDTSLNDIRIVTGKSADEMANFASQANAAAQSLGKTTVDYTKAALIYAQQGLSDEDIATRAAITLKTANVTGQSTDAVSEQLTSVWNGYKVSAEQAELYIDRLAAVAATTASNLEELSTGMSKVAAAAAAMGVGQDQLAAQLSTIISVTRQAPESVGTALRTVYARISDIKAGIDEDGVDLGRYSGKMAALGFNVLDVSGKLRDMGEVIEEIGGKWATLSREQQISLAQTMAGQRQYSNLIALFDNFDKYTEALHTAQNAAGTLQKQQDTYMQSTRSHLNQLKTATQNLYDSLINPDSLEPLIDGLSKVLNLSATFVDSIGGGGSLLASLGAIGVTVFSEQIAKGINTTITNFEVAKNNASQLGQVLDTIQQWKGIPELDQVTQELLQYRQQLFELTGAMSPEQFSGVQTLINDLTALSNRLIALQDEKEILNKTIESVLSYKDTWKTAEDVIADPKGQEQVLNRFEEQKNALQSIITLIKQYTLSFSKINNKLINGEDISEDVEQAKTHIQSYIDKLSELSGKGVLSERNNEIFNKLKQNFEFLDDSIPDDEAVSKMNNILHGLQGVATNAENTIENTRKKIEDNFVDGINSLNTKIEEGTQQLSRKEQQTLEELAKARREKLIKNYAQITGGIAQMGAAIQQIQNLGSIWKNSDLDVGEKILRTVTNLSMSLPMLASGLVKTATAMGLLKVVTTETAIAETVANANTIAYIGGLKIMKTEAGATAIAIEGLNTVLTINPATFWIVGITAVVAVLAGVASAAKKANEQLIKFNQTQIEEQKKKQQQIDKNQQLLISIQKLNKEYEDGQIATRTALRAEIDKLIDQYGVEENYIDKLIAKYGNLSTAIRQARIEAEDERLQSLTTQQQATYTNIIPTAKKTAASTQFNGYITTAFGRSSNDTSSKLLQELSKIGYNRTDNDWVISSENNPEAIIKLYNDTVQAVNNANLTLDEKQDSFVQKVLTWISQMGAVIDRQEQLRKDIQESDLNLKIRRNLNSDFSNIESFEQYQKQREALITSTEGDREAVITAVDNELKTFYTDLYNKYNDTTEYYDKLVSQFGEKNSKNILNALKKLDSAHLSVLQEFDLSTLNKWEDLQQIIERISKIDLSNVEDLTEDADVSYASDNYNFYQSLEDQVKSGKTISSSEHKKLIPQVQQYFTKMANGSYKMTEDAKSFYNTIDSLKLQGFYDSINSINKEIEKNQQLSEYKSTYNKYEGLKVDNIFDDKYFNAHLNKTAFTGGGKGRAVPTINYDLVDEQLKYLSVVSQTDEVLNAQVDIWQKLANEHKLSYKSVIAIAEQIDKAGNQTENLKEKSEELKEELVKAEQQLYDALFPPDVDLDESALTQATRTIQELSKSSEQLSDQLSENARTANQIAEAILRFDNAIQDVVDNYDNWLLALSQENVALGDKAVILPQLRDAYADMLDIDGSLLTDEFLLSVENLEWMKAAIDGDIEAYDKLAQAARLASLETLRLDPSIDMDIFDNELESLRNRLENFNDFSKIEIGAEINDQAFLTRLSEMLNKMNVTAAQASDILRENLGIDTQIIQVKDNATETQEFPKTTAVLTPVDREGYVDIPVGSNGGIRPQRVKLHQRAWSTSYEPDTESITTKKEGSGFALKVTSANKSAGGKFKFSNASRGGGAAGVARRTAAAEKAAKASAAAKPVTKQTKDSTQDNRDIYHDINIELSQIARSLQRVQKQQSRLYGKQLIDNLNKQSQILEQHKAKLKEKLALQKQDLANQKENLRLLGATFDEAGHISNYMDLLGGSQGAVNGAIASYNSLVNQFNAMQTKEEQQALQDQLTASEEHIKDIQDAHKKLEKAIKDYDSLRNQIEDVVDQIEAQTQKQIEIQITKFRMSVEISLDMSSAQRDWNKFKREVIQADKILKDTNFDTIFKNANLNSDDILSYFNPASGESLQQLTTQIKNTSDQLAQLNKQGESAIYSDRKKELLDHLRSDLNKLMGDMEDIQGLIQNIDQAVLDTYDDIKTQMDQQIDDYEFVNDTIEHNIDLLKLLYGDEQYEAMNSYYEQQRQNQLQQIGFLRQATNWAKTQWEQAEKNGQTELAKQLKQEWKDLYNQLDNAVKEHAQLLQNEYVNAINGIFDALDKRVTNGLGLEYIQMEWELINKNADQYLDAINSAYALQDLQFKYQKTINDTKSVKNQKVLTDLMNQQLDQLKSKDKLTQYDVDRAERLLEIEKARLALEDTRNAKTSLRLKRDSQGNYSYVYSANDDQINEATEKLAKLKNDLYNFDKNAYKDNLNDILSAYKDFRQRAEEIAIKYKNDDAQRQLELAKLKQEYMKYISGKVEENTVIRTNLTSSAFTEYSQLYKQDYDAYTQMIQGELDAFEVLLGEMVPGWNSGIQQMTNNFNIFGDECERVFAELDQTTLDYKGRLKEVQEEADKDFEQIRTGALDPTIVAFQDLIQKNDALINKFDEEIDKIWEVKSAVDKLLESYNDAWEEAIKVVDANNQIWMQEQQEAKRAAKEDNNSTPEPVPVGNPSLPTTPTLNTSISGSNSPTLSSSNEQVLEQTLKTTATPKASLTELQLMGRNLAGAIYWGLWGSKIKEVVNDNMVDVFGVNKGTEYFNQAWKIYSQPKYSPGKGSALFYDYSYEQLKKKYKNRLSSGYTETSLDTGGYTGEWGPEGRIALLHQKQPVLNADDTKNMLDSVGILRGVVQKIGGSITSRLSGLNAGFKNGVNNSDILEQNVSINATFPNVDSKREIEEAFNDLVNLAAQRAMRKAK